MATRVEPTPDQLLSVFQIARKAHWPESLADALADPILGRIVRLHAQHLAEGRDDFAAARVHHRPEVIAPEAPHPAEAKPVRRAPSRRKPTPPKPPARPLPLPVPTHSPGLFDRKRAAAADNDDD